MKTRLFAHSRRFRHVVLLVGIMLASSVFAISGGTASAITHNLVKYPKSKMTRLSLKKVLSAKRPNGSGSLQGFAMTDKYYVLIMRPPGEEDRNQVVVIRRSDNKNVTANFGNPVYNMGHGNDATWNSKTNEIIVVDSGRRELVRLDANTFKRKGIAKLTDSTGKALFAGGIAYDKERNNYYATAGPSVRAYNTKNQLVFSFQEKHNQTNQGFAYNNGYLYRPTWESAGSYPDSIYDGIFKKHTTVLYQFGLDGSFTHAYYIDNPLYEVESMDFDENKVPYLAFNGPSGEYSIYKITDSNLLKQLRQSYTISYFDNGGTGSPKNQTAYIGIERSLSSTKPTRSGYDFLGWSTNKSATKASYAAGAKFLKAYGASNANVKLYAVWKQKTYTVTYNANGGTNAPAVQTVAQTQNATISKTKPTRSGYDFLGWSTSKDATSASYQPGATYAAKKTITLYAVWKQKTYTVTYNANGGTNAPAAQTAAINQAITIPSAKPTRANYTFLGWSDSSSATSAKYSPGASYISDKNIVFYAVWKQNAPVAPIIQTITITYDANGGANVPSATTGEVGKIAISSSKPTRAFYEFLGWSTSKSATSADYQPGAKYAGASSTTLYAVWKQKYVSVTYDANGGANAPAAQSPAMGQEFALATAVPSRKGYKFLGWNANGDAKEAKYMPGARLTLEADLRLYAIWERESYTITFNANGGMGAPLPVSTDSNEIILPQTRPTRSGYTFIGWSTKADSIGAEYQPGDVVKDVKNLTLYAIWQVIERAPIADTTDDDTINEKADTKDGNTDEDVTETNNGEDDNTIAPTIEDPDELPATGPVEIAVAIIAGTCVACGVVYWSISSKRLSELRRTVHGDKNKKN